MAKTVAEKYAYNRQWRAANKDKVDEYNRRYREKNRERIRVMEKDRREGGQYRASKRKYWLKRYGLCKDSYDVLLQAQGGVCAICHSECSRHPSLSVDHCHTTEQIRGLLCHSCNLALGNLEDDPARARAAAAYLEAASEE